MMEGEDDYDLDAVEAKLAQLALRRERLLTLNATKQQRPAKCAPAMAKQGMVGFDLEQVDEMSDVDSDGDSDGTNSVVSDDEADSRSHPKLRSSAHRLRDSLDLSMSMSVADLPASVEQNAPVLRSKPSLAKTPTESNKSHASDVQNPMALHREPIEAPSKLIERRRLLEREAVQSAKASAEHPEHRSGGRSLKCSTRQDNGLEKGNQIQAAAQGRATTSHIPLPKQQHHPGATAQTELNHPAVTAAEKPLSNGVGVATAIPTRTAPAAHRALERKQPVATAMSVGGGGARPSAVASHRPEAAAVDLPHGNGSRLTVPSCTGPVAVASAIPRQRTVNQLRPGIPQKESAKMPTSKLTSESEPESQPEDLDVFSVEEERLRKSLEKLDTRLTKLSSPRASIGGSHSNSSAKLAPRVESNSGKGVSSALGDIDDNQLRAAAYGGGTHARLHQQSSPASRLSLAKRAEQSSGLPKARVRTGGILVQEKHEYTAGDTTHKVVIKKDLAHLLF